jgi:aspartate/methionine/tyrosine aminotransferase
MLLAKCDLPNDYIDAGIGEAHVVRDALLSIFDISAIDLPKDKGIFEYQEPQGYKPLVQLLEAKHQAPVIIVNGAKQGLGAICYALKQLGKSNLALPRPWWCLIPPLMEMHGVNHIIEDDLNADSYLCVAPNNPCGNMPDMKTLSESMKERGIPLIHDGAYYSHTYLPQSYKLDSFGDAQIYSISKLFGISSIRLGYVVCGNTELYKLILHYVEAMTVGVSIVSQIFLYNLLNTMRGYPTLTEKFEHLSYAAIRENKLLIKQVDSSILEVPNNIEDTNGMFLWCKIKDFSLLEKVKINTIDGKHFGMPDYVRMNLGLEEDKIKEIIRRLNQNADC